MLGKFVNQVQGVSRGVLKQHGWKNTSCAVSRQYFSTKDSDSTTTSEELEQQIEGTDVTERSTEAVDASKLKSESNLLIEKAMKQADANDKFGFFELSEETAKKLFPEGLSKKIEEVFDYSGDRRLMLRETTSEIISSLKDWTNSSESRPSAFVIDGDIGNGKSVALTQIVQYARENDWICLYVPRARAWCYEAPYVIKSAYDSSKFDVDVFGIKLLKEFAQCHSHQLSQIKIKGSYSSRYYPRSFETKPDASKYSESDLTLLDIVENGIKDEELACQAVVDLRSELSQVTEFPVLIAIDEINTWFGKTVFGYEGKDVFPSDISVINALNDLGPEGLKSEKKLKNGLFIGATTEAYPALCNNLKSKVDYRSLRKTMKVYSPEELKQMVAYCRKINFLQEDLDDLKYNYLRMMTKSTPKRVFDRICLM